MKNGYLWTAAMAGALILTACNSKDDAKTMPVVPESSAEVDDSQPNPVTDVADNGFLDPNSASLADIAAIDGMPEGVAELLISARPFANAKALDNFLKDHGNAKVRNTIYEDMFIPMPLNTTQERHFMVIPGVGKKMAHEFEEYRPYTDWEQFEREIGKYVDAEEVARLRRYVTLD